MQQAEQGQRRRAETCNKRQLRPIPRLGPLFQGKLAEAVLTSSSSVHSRKQQQFGTTHVAAWHCSSQLQAFAACTRLVLHLCQLPFSRMELPLQPVPCLPTERHLCLHPLHADG